MVWLPLRSINSSNKILTHPPRGASTRGDCKIPCKKKVALDSQLSLFEQLIHGIP